MSQGRNWGKCVEIVSKILTELSTELSKTKGEERRSCFCARVDEGKMFYFFGGWVRDGVVRGIPDDDIPDLDMRIESRELADKFLDTVRMCGMVKSSVRDAEGYGLLKIVLVLPGSDAVYPIDINYPHEGADKTKMLCDFTANNLCMGADGSIWTRYFPGNGIVGESKQSWLGTCLRDATNKTLRWMVPKFYTDDSQIKHFKLEDEARRVMLQMEKRQTKMVLKGFEFPEDGTASSVTGFMLPTPE